MPITPTYPGVYTERIPSGVRTITGVSTSVAAFVGYFSQGLMNKAIQIFNIGDFDREFGGLNRRSEASYAIQQFFLNGGTEAWVVRTASGGVAAASVEILDGIGGSPALTIEAGQLDPATHPELTNPGTWGNNLRVSIDYPTPVSGDRFSMTVSLVEVINGRQVVVRSEVFNGLSMDATDPAHFVEAIVNDEFSGSKLVRVTASGSQRPMQNGTISGVLPPSLTLTTTATTPQLFVTIGTEGRGTARLTARPTTPQAARGLLEAAIRAARPDLRAFSQASVSLVDNRLRILAGPTASEGRIAIAPTDTDSTATDLELASGTQLQGVMSGNITSFPPSGTDLQISIGRSGPAPLTLGTMDDLSEVRDALEAAIRGAANHSAVIAAEQDAFTNARVATYTQGGESRLIVLAGLPGKAVTFTAAETDTLVDDLGLGTATPISALLSNEITTASVDTDSEVYVRIGGLDGGTEPFIATITADANDLTDIATGLESAIRVADPVNSPPFTGVRVAAYSAGGENRLIVLPGVTGDVVYFADFDDGTTTDPIATDLQLTDSLAAFNLQSYALVAGAAIPNTAQGNGTVGADGDPPDSAALIGDSAAKTGMHALRDVDLFNILCIPRTAIISGADALDATQAFAVLAAAKDFCEERRAFLLIDTPTGIDAVQEVKDWLDANNNLRSQNAAFYFPRVLIPDPLNDFKLRAVGASGTIAGLYARTDSDRGVWKAPAGTEATLENVFKLEVPLTDPENGTLNKVAINCLRTFPIYGTICWGARTLDGADEIGSEYKYVPVSRLALFLEESLFRGLKWVVFEPNDEPLWAQIRLNVGAFMNTLFRQGAFQGQTPRQAYLVKCDKETTTQNDIDRGIVNILVGFAPLKPAEFVFIKLQQLAGQIQA
jgi:phage tail sheath protein FI